MSEQLNLRPLNSDILLRRCNDPTDDHENGSAIIQVKREQNSKMQWFDVVAVSSTVDDVVVGDKVMVPLGKYTLPIDLDGEQLVATSVDQVWVVWEAE